MEESVAARRQNIAVPESIPSEELATQGDDGVITGPHATVPSGGAASPQDHDPELMEHAGSSAKGAATLSPAAAAVLVELQRMHREFIEKIHAMRESLALEGDSEEARKLTRELDDDEVEFNAYLQARWDEFSKTDETAMAYAP